MVPANPVPARVPVKGKTAELHLQLQLHLHFHLHLQSVLVTCLPPFYSVVDMGGLVAVLTGVLLGLPP